MTVAPGFVNAHLRGVQGCLIGPTSEPMLHSEKGGGLNGSVQHWLAVYLPESEIPKFFWDADSGAAPPRRVLLENALTGLFF